MTPPPEDSYAVFLLDPIRPWIDVGGYALIGIFIELIDTTANALDSTDLPLTPPDLSAFDRDLSSLDFGLADYFHVRFELTSLMLVPEPSTAVVGGIGFLGLFACRRRKCSEI